MKILPIFIGIIIFAFNSLYGQAPVPGNTPLPPTETPKSITLQRQPNIDAMRGVSSGAGTNSGLYIGNRNPAYRKPSKKDLLLVAPDAEDQEKYAEFLRQPKTDLIRLLSDEGCQENSNVTITSEFCIKYKNVFGGSAYSFRTKNYALGRFADVAYKDGTLYSVGKMTLGLIADLGENISLADISANTKGAKYIFDIVPPDTLPNIENYLAQLQKGIENGGFKYQRFYKLQENHTYLLRSVAYRKTGETEKGRRIYDDLVNDEREDVIIAFQVVRFADADKSSVTLLWKELQRKDAPKVSVKGN